MFVSPNLIYLMPPTLKTCLRRIGSKIGSRSSPTLSNRRGRPSLRAYSNLCTKFSASDGFNMINLDPVLLLSCISIFLIHLFACPYGSIMRGHLSPFCIMIPFSIENESAGSPLICQRLICTGSPKTLSRENWSSVFNESIFIW